MFFAINKGKRIMFHYIIEEVNKGLGKLYTRARGGSRLSAPGTTGLFESFHLKEWK
jgi:hypothetical protein